MPVIRNTPTQTKLPPFRSATDTGTCNEKDQVEIDLRTPANPNHLVAVDWIAISTDTTLDEAQAVNFFQPSEHENSRKQHETHHRSRTAGSAPVTHDLSLAI